MFGKRCRIIHCFFVIVVFFSFSMFAQASGWDCEDATKGLKLSRVRGDIEIDGWLATGKQFMQYLNYDNEKDIEIYHYKVPKGKTLMSGYIVKPSGKGPFPALVLNHGGYQSARRFLLGWYRQFGIILAKQGYVVIACDYTHTYDMLLKYGHAGPKAGWGAASSEENISRALKNIGILKCLSFVDNNRIAMLGISMGGYLTVGVAQKTKDLKAAIVIVAGINGESHLSPPEELVKDISCPMLLLNGDSDGTVGLGPPTRLKFLLDEYNKTSEFIIFPDAGHELPLRDPISHSRQDRVFKKVYRFLDMHM